MDNREPNRRSQGIPIPYPPMEPNSYERYRSQRNMIPFPSMGTTVGGPQMHQSSQNSPAQASAFYQTSQALQIPQRGRTLQRQEFYSLRNPHYLHEEEASYSYQDSSSGQDSAAVTDYDSSSTRSSRYSQMSRSSPSIFYLSPARTPELHSLQTNQSNQGTEGRGRNANMRQCNLCRTMVPLTLFNEHQQACQNQNQGITVAHRDSASASAGSTLDNSVAMPSQHMNGTQFHAPQSRAHVRARSLLHGNTGLQPQDTVQGQGRSVHRRRHTDIYQSRSNVPLLQELRELQSSAQDNSAISDHENEEDES